MPVEQTHATPYQGPCVVLTVEEAGEVMAALDGHLAIVRDSDLAESVRAKCRRALNSDPRWRTPLR